MSLVQFGFRGILRGNAVNLSDYGSKLDIKFYSDEPPPPPLDYVRFLLFSGISLAL